MICDMRNLLESTYLKHSASPKDNGPLVSAIAKNEEKEVVARRSFVFLKDVHYRSREES